MTERDRERGYLLVKSATVRTQMLVFVWREEREREKKRLKKSRLSGNYFIIGRRHFVLPIFFSLPFRFERKVWQIELLKHSKAANIFNPFIMNVFISVVIILNQDLQAYVLLSSVWAVKMQNLVISFRRSVPIKLPLLYNFLVTT